MLPKITRRRKAAAVTALMAGSVLGAGVPALVLSSSHDSAQAAVAAIRLQVNGSVDVTFAKFGGSTYDATPAQPSSGNTKAIVNAIPPTITLSAPFAASQVAYQDMIAWEQAVRAGSPTGRADAIVTLISPAGKAIATYHLSNGFPVKVDVAAGDPQTTSFTVELTGDELTLVNATS